jgi:hypothetical protein
VSSVNSKQGVVILDPDDLDDAATAHKFVTAGDLTNLGNLSGTNSGDETAASIGSLIGGAAAATPLDTDEVATALTGGGNLVKITWLNVKAFLKTYFDTLYRVVGSVLLAEGETVSLDEAGSVDGAYTGVSTPGTLGETVALGQVVYYKFSDGKWWLADASAVATAGDVEIGICVDGGVADDTTTILMEGVLRADAQFPTFVSGQVYISETAGAVTQTLPATTDAVVRVIGYGRNGNEMRVSVSPDHITVV